MWKKAITLLVVTVLVAGLFAGCGAKKTDEVVEKATDPTCGMEVAMTADAITLEHDGKTEYFCSEECKAKYLESASETMLTCPTCGMEVVVTDETPTYEYDGETYYLCSADCKVKFVADPAKYMEAHHEEMEEEMHGDDEHHGM